MREEKATKAKLKALEMAQEEAREARIKELQERGKRDAEIDAQIGSRSAAAAVAANQKSDEPYLHPSDPSFLIGKRPDKPKKEAFVPDFDPDEVPPLE